MNYKRLVQTIDSASQQLAGRAVTAVNQALVVRNWMVGAYLVEFEQAGADRAKYGQRLLATLADDLKARGLKGLDERTLRDCRTFFGLYPQIRGSVNPELPEPLEIAGRESIACTMPAKRPAPGQDSTDTVGRIRGSVTPELPTPLSGTALLRLPWTHFQLFLRLDDPWKRAFYENECLKSRWSEVEYATAGMDNRLFVSRYLVALPRVEQLRHFLEADRDRIEATRPPAREKTKSATRTPRR